MSKRLKLAVLPVVCLTAMVGAAGAQAHTAANPVNVNHTEGLTLTGLPGASALTLCTPSAGCRSADVPGITAAGGLLTLTGHGHGSNAPTVNPNTDCPNTAQQGKWFRLESIGGSRLDYVKITFTDAFGQSTELVDMSGADGRPVAGGTAYSIETGLCVGSQST